MRAFARNEGIDAFRYGFVQIAAGATRDDSDALAELWPAGNEQRFGTSCALKTRPQFRSGDSGPRLKAEKLAVIEKEWLPFVETECGAKLGIIA